MSDESKLLDQLFSAPTAASPADDAVTTFSMVPLWVRATGEYQDEYTRRKAKTTDFIRWPWRQPVPSEETIQAQAAVAAMRAVASKLKAKLDGINTQAKLLESSLKAIEKVSG